MPHAHADAVTGNNQGNCINRAWLPGCLPCLAGHRQWLPARMAGEGPQRREGDACALTSYVVIGLGRSCLIRDTSFKGRQGVGTPVRLLRWGPGPP